MLRLLEEGSVNEAEVMVCEERGVKIAERLRVRLSERVL
jgi:hypothetical protein